MKTIILTFLVYLSSTLNAFAYIDPGTGGIIIQAIIGAIAAVSIFFSNLKYKIKTFFKRIFKKIK